MHTTQATTLPTLLGVPAVADELGIAKRTVYMLVAKGELDHVRVGRRVLIPSNELRRFVDAHRVTTTSPGRRFVAPR